MTDTTPPPQVQKMLMHPGVYVVSNSKQSGHYVVVHVSENGDVQQMKFDGRLASDGWRSDVVIRGPLNFDSPVIEP